jgi:ParG
MGDRVAAMVLGPAPKSGRGVARTEPVKRVNGYVPFRIWRQFRARCEAEGRSMSDVLTECVADWLSSARR